jgi:U4/U6.U5 tri-snRNP component SNU23
MAGVRRTWDKELFAQKARDRQEFGDDFVDDKDGQSSSKPKRIVRDEAKDEENALSEKAFIKSRNEKLDLDKEVGKSKIINPLEDGAKAGFWCDVCKCLLKDSASYLDHLNGKKRKFLAT